MDASNASSSNAWVDSYLDARERTPPREGFWTAIAHCMATHTRRATQSVARRAAVLSFGLSSEYSAATKDESKAPNADRSLYSR